MLAEAGATTEIVERLFAEAQLQLLPGITQQAAVSRVLHQCMLEAPNYARFRWRKAPSARPECVVLSLGVVAG
jgi:hypothetical protein